MTEAPLSGLTILDLSRVLSGPYCTMLAADMGARVIKIEHPERGDDTRAWGPPFVGGESAYYLSINRNKESVAVDFKSDAGRAILDALVSRADVLVENFRPGGLDRPGVKLGPHLPGSTGSASGTRPSLSDSHASSMSRFPASASTGRAGSSPATTRSRRPRAG